jgi:small-conductance mechanosensitive channel
MIDTAMMVVLAQAPDGGPAPVAPQVGLTIILLALLASWPLYRLSSIELLERFRSYILLGVLALWGLAVVELVFIISHTLTASWLPVAIFLLASGVLANFQWLRNLMAGLSLAFEGHLSTGDAIRVDDVEGNIKEFGLRSTRIRGLDGRIHDVPNSLLVDEEVTNLEAGGDSACQVTVALPEGISVDEARRLARQAATLSPLASPRHEAEIFTETGPADETRFLRIRGFAIDASFQDRYRSDINARLFEAFDRVKA